MRPRSAGSSLRAAWWLAALAGTGVALALLYPDSYQQDGGNHYLGARWAWAHPEFFVDVWGRPLFTLLYSLPARLGYTAAKLFTVAICLATAWQTWRLAEDLGLERAELAIPLLALQPSYLLLSAETMTEPLFALLFAIALRLHAQGRVVAGMIVASTLVLARPEGFFVGLLWGVWVLCDWRDGRPWWRRLPATLWLASGAVAWWLAALVITGDPLYILHNWPPNWGATDAVYGTDPFWHYWKRRDEIVGPLLVLPFLLGLGLLLVRRRMGVATSAVLAFFLLHSVFRVYGLFGSAGYVRYFVCVAPAIALITLVGWNAIANPLSRVRGAVTIVAALALMESARIALLYVDSMPWSRDARAVSEMYGWFRAHEHSVRRLVWSQAYMCILFDRDPLERPALSADKARNFALLRESPGGTLVFWDAETGPLWYGIGPADLEAAGYERLRSASYSLEGLFPGQWWAQHSGPRRQEMHLFYKGETRLGVRRGWQVGGKPDSLVAQTGPVAQVVRARA